MFKGNVDKVMAQSKEIARRLRETNVPLENLRVEYQCRYETLLKVIRKEIDEKEYKELTKHGRRGNPGCKRTDKPVKIKPPKPTSPEPPMTAQVTNSTFEFSNGFGFEAADLGTDGVKLTLANPHEEPAAIMLPKEITEQFAFWLLRTHGQMVPQMPNGLAEMLKRAAESKNKKLKLKYGDKTRCKRAVEVLEFYRPRSGAAGAGKE